ncbi:MAG: chromate transporter [Alphaproteobacteria bacterium]|nr:chromate transporter [Alphaproteobacteria bacterium]
MADSPGDAARHRPSLPTLLLEFLKLSLLGFGGGIALAHRMAVERRGWLSEAEFTDVLALCQFMPGPNVVGIAICIGTKTRGFAGALTAFFGFAVIPGAFGISLGVLLFGQAGNPPVQHVLRGISAAAAGLMIATGLRLLRGRSHHLPTVALAALAFAGLTLARLPLLLVLLGLVPLSVGTTLLTRKATR